MAFFRQFPRTFYNIDNNLVNIPDIFRRVVPTDLFDNMSYMLEFDIQDGQIIASGDYFDATGMVMAISAQVKQE